MAVSRKTERLERIVQILRENNGASVKQLSTLLDVTEMTIRRDLEALRESNIVTLVHGAAIYNPSVGLEEDPSYHILHETGVMGVEKRRIGKAAAKLLEPGDVIFIDIGTTAVWLAHHIPPGLPITAACFTMNALQALMKKNIASIVVGGGQYHPNTQMFEGPETVQTIKNMRATKAFISAAGVSRELGLTCVDKYEAPTKMACMESALQIILLADSSKFGAVKPTYFGELGNIDLVITDKGLSDEWQAVLQEMKIPVMLV